MFIIWKPKRYLLMKKMPSSPSIMVEYMVVKIVRKPSRILEKQVTHWTQGPPHVIAAAKTAQFLNTNFLGPHKNLSGLFTRKDIRLQDTREVSYKALRRSSRVSVTVVGVLTFRAMKAFTVRAAAAARGATRAASTSASPLPVRLRTNLHFRFLTLFLSFFVGS